MASVSLIPIEPTRAGTWERVAEAWLEACQVVRRSFVAAVATSIAIGFLWPTERIMAVCLAACGALLALAALVDAHEFRLPNRLLATTALLAAAGAALGGSDGALLGCALGGVVAGGAVAVVHVRRGIGFGDVKMAGVVGMSLGSIELRAAPVAIAVAATAAAIFGATTGRQRLALGPALWLGWAVTAGSLAMGWWT
jgi:leader peptidase (prepilin peptidase)/N-methyltransferase